MAKDLRILLLGGAGFVGKHLHRALVAHFGPRAQILITSRDSDGPGVAQLDIRDGEGFRSLLHSFNPTHVVNLAGIAAPVEARRNPDLAWQIHAIAPQRLGQILLAERPDCWFLHVSSGMIYGRTALSGKPLDEAAPVEPMDIYGVTKAAGDLALGALASEGLKSLRLRPFNHTGPGQSEDFAIPAFAAQISLIKAGRQSPEIKVGNLSAVRDFLDVRDVADAYVHLINQSDTLKPGTIFNISSGRGQSIQAMLDALIAASGLNLKSTPDPERQRPNDLPIILGDCTALRNTVGWLPTRQIEQTLQDVLTEFYLASPR